MNQKIEETTKMLHGFCEICDHLHFPAFGQSDVICNICNKRRPMFGGMLCRYRQCFHYGHPLMKGYCHSFTKQKLHLFGACDVEVSFGDTLVDFHTRHERTCIQILEQTLAVTDLAKLILTYMYFEETLKRTIARGLILPSHSLQSLCDIL